MSSTDEIVSCETKKDGEINTRKRTLDEIEKDDTDFKQEPVSSKTNQVVPNISTRSVRMVGTNSNTTGGVRMNNSSTVSGARVITDDTNQRDSNRQVLYHEFMSCKTFSDVEKLLPRFTQSSLPVVFSGGAIGSDQLWADKATMKNIFTCVLSFTGHTVAYSHSKKELVLKLGNKELVSVDQNVNKISALLHRHIKFDFIRNLMRRNMYQIQQADRVYAIGYIDNQGKIDGGTAWACEAFFQLGKTDLYIFDINSCMWLKKSDQPTDERIKKVWIKVVPPLLLDGKCKTAALIGTREISKSTSMFTIVKNAMDDVLADKTNNTDDTSTNTNVSMSLLSEVDLDTDVSCLGRGLEPVLKRIKSE